MSKSTVKKCLGIKKDGTACNAPGAFNGYCISHSPDPAVKEKKRQASIRGGKATVKFNLKLGDKFKVRGITDFKIMLERYMEQLNTSGVGITPSSMAAMAQLANAYARLVKESELEAKVEGLQKLVEERQKS